MRAVFDPKRGGNVSQKKKSTLQLEQKKVNGHIVDLIQRAPDTAPKHQQSCPSPNQSASAATGQWNVGVVPSKLHQGRSIPSAELIF